ncbi:oligosaccharide flippase family protein [Faecalicatena sp. Marseille-Q4148]|nr:oligosaccharide flippase family protein [Faecalicatena sp. Marseille-Q4148]
MNLRRAAKTAFVYFAGNVLSKLVIFILFPLYTVYIDPVQYGNYDLACSIINLIAPIAFVQIWDAVFRFSFDSEKTKDKYALISNTFVVSIIGVGVYIILMTAVNAFMKFDYYPYVAVYGLAFAFQYVYAYSARVFLNNTLYVFSGVLNTIVSVVLNVILIVNFHWDVKSLYVSAIIGILLQILVIEWKLKLIKNFSIKDINFKVVERMVKFSIPLCIATVSYWLLSGYSRIILDKYVGGVEVGLYAVANRLASIVTVVMSIFQFAWNEAAYLMAQDEERKKVYKSFVDILLKTMCWIIAMLIIFIRIVFPFYIGPEYQDAVWIIPATIIGVSANAVAAFISTLFMTEKQTSFIMTSTVIASVFNVVFAIFSAKRFGIQGVVVTLMISFVILLVLRIWSMVKLQGIKLGIDFLYALTALIISVILFYLISNTVFLIGILFVLIVLALFDIREVISLCINKWRKEK